MGEGRQVVSLICSLLLLISYLRRNFFFLEKSGLVIMWLIPSMEAWVHISQWSLIEGTLSSFHRGDNLEKLIDSSSI